MELTILLVQTSGTVAFAFMLRQAGRQTVTVELTILLVQTSWQCGSSIYAKAGRQAATVELTLLEVRFSWHCGSCSYVKAGKQAVTVELTLLQIQTSQHCSSHIYVTPTKLIHTKDSHYFMQPKLMQQKKIYISILLLPTFVVTSQKYTYCIWKFNHF